LMAWRAPMIGVTSLNISHTTCGTNSPTFAGPRDDAAWHPRREGERQHDEDEQRDQTSVGVVLGMDTHGQRDEHANETHRHRQVHDPPPYAFRLATQLAAPAVATLATTAC